MILASISWRGIAVFFGIVAVYLVALGIFALIKFILNKRKFKKEVKEREEQEEKKQ